MSKSQISLFFVFLFGLSGCIGEMYKQHTANYPSFNAVSRQAPLAANKGRVYVYYPLKGADDIPFNPLQGVGTATMGFSSAFVLTEKRHYAQIVDGSFGYVDLAPG